MVIGTTTSLACGICFAMKRFRGRLVLTDDDQRGRGDLSAGLER
jgi:hypothetical protein